MKKESKMLTKDKYNISLIVEHKTSLTYEMQINVDRKDIDLHFLVD